MHKGSIENWLDPDKLRPHLIAVSLYIAAFELLKASIIDRLKSFFSAPGSLSPDQEYATEVLSRNRSATYASLSWLKEQHVIDEADIVAFENIKTLRNGFAHTITRTLTDGIPGDFADLFAKMILLLTKIERWWIIHVDMATDPAFDGQEVQENEVTPGPVVALRIMMEVALGPELDAKKYIEGFRNRKGSKPSQ